MTAALLARRYLVDVSTDASTWVPVGEIYAFLPVRTANRRRMVVFGSPSPGSFIDGQTWTATLSYRQSANDSDTRDAGQLLLEACLDEISADAALYVRWYDADGLPDAKQGHATVEVTPAHSGGNDELSNMTATFTGDGALASIDNPLP